MQDNLTKVVWIASVQVVTKPKIPWFPSQMSFKKFNKYGFCFTRKINERIGRNIRKHYNLLLLWLLKFPVCSTA